jgi:hypothetical protein
MAIFNNMAITSKGQVLYAKAQAGKELKFTKMMIGSGKITTQDPSLLTALLEPKYDVGIQSITPNTIQKNAAISGSINNSNMTEAVYICEIGLFAQDPDDGEILYAYGTAGEFGDYMAPASSGPYSWNYVINAAVGNAANVTVILSNLSYDYSVLNSNTTFMYISGSNQKEINQSIDNKFKVYPTSNSGNIYSVTVSGLTTLTDGYPLTIKFNVASTGNVSLKVNNLDAISLVDYFGNQVNNVRKDLIANIRYDATNANFQLLGKGGGGNATADQVLDGKKVTVDSGPIVGTMPNNGSINKSLGINETYTISKGYHDGTGKVSQNIATKSAQTYTPGTTNQTIAAGQYLSENQIILGDENLIADNIVKDKTIFGVDGNASKFQYASGTATISSPMDTPGWYSTSVTVPFDIKGVRFDQYGTNTSNLTVCLDIEYFEFPASSPYGTIVLKSDDNLVVNKESNGDWSFSGIAAGNYGISSYVNGNTLYLSGHAETYNYPVNGKWYVIGY